MSYIRKVSKFEARCNHLDCMDLPYDEQSLNLFDLELMAISHDIDCELVTIRDYHGTIPFEPSFFQPAEDNFLTKYPVDREQNYRYDIPQELNEPPPVWDKHLKDACERRQQLLLVDDPSSLIFGEESLFRLALKTYKRDYRRWKSAEDVRPRYGASPISSYVNSLAYVPRRGMPLEIREFRPDRSLCGLRDLARAADLTPLRSSMYGFRQVPVQNSMTICTNNRQNKV